MEQTKNPPQQRAHKDVYQMVTDRIIEQLNKGTVPWQQPWKAAGLPRNLLTNRAYRGINMLLLNSLGYEHNLFVTYNQLNRELGGKVKKGEEGHIITYWNYGDKGKGNAEDAEASEDGEKPKKAPLLRYYTVFNISQCENIPESYLEQGRVVDVIATCEEVVESMPQCPVIQHKGQKATYNPLEDVINMPKKASFTSDAGYYSTLFHELVHSTGHHSRLNRKDLIQMAEFGSEPYSHEELVAEIGACYLQSITGIAEEFEQSAAYVQGWLQKLKNDKRFILSASTHAQKAIDFILNVKTEAEAEHLEE
jgi:antirestriction protein ArdC